MSAINKRVVCNLLLSLSFVHVNVPAAEKPFTGVFQGQGRGCWGKLYITSKTIEWNTPYSVCKKTSYKVIAEERHSTSPHIAYAVDKKSAHCRYNIVEISFDPEYPEYWQAAGYQSQDDFDHRAQPAKDAVLRTLMCSVKKED